MVREIVKDVDKLNSPLDKVTKEDYLEAVVIIADLIDTALHYKDICLGLAANQIGYNKRIIVARVGTETFMPLINPVITKRSTIKEKSFEGCLSLDGEREVTRYRSVEVMFQNRYSKTQRLKCTGLLAKIMQHEIDHCNGVLI